MNNEIKEYPKEQQKLKDYLDNVTIEQIINKLKDDDGMTWWVDYQDQYQPNWKKIYAKEVQLLLDYITNLQDKLQWYENIDNNKTIDKFRYEQNMKVKNLQQRIEKAVEYLDALEIHEDYDNYLQPYYIEDKQNNVLDIDYLVKNIKKILNGKERRINE